MEESPSAPAAAVRGYQRWRSLLFLHWPVASAPLARLLPAGLSLDEFAGQAYVGLVLFAMEGVRPRWVPEVASFSFLETNVRTYVHRAGVGPGVYFFSLDAESWLAVQAARLGWNLPYFHARMRSTRAGELFSYDLERHARSRPGASVRFEIGEPLGAAPVGSLEHFLVERYSLYVAQRKGLFRGQVRHPPYPLRSVRLLHCEESLLRAAGIEKTTETPPLVHYADGVDVDIFGLERVT